MRFSVQWKAYCWRDEAERGAYAAHTDDLEPEAAFEALVAEARRRGAVTGEEEPVELATRLCRTFIRVPAELVGVHNPDPVNNNLVPNAPNL